MSRLRAVAAVLTLGAPLLASAADITRVASSFEDDDPFGLFVDAGLEYSQQNARILRETSAAVLDPASQHTTPPKLGEALNYSRHEARLHFDVAAGISRDVELSFGLPLVLLRNEDWGIPTGALADIPVSSAVVNYQGEKYPATADYRWGLGNARFGIAWAIFNQKKDDTKPMWVARLDYEAPTAPPIDLRLSANSSLTGRPFAVGDRVHKYTLSTALSRKIGIAEPYFKVAYTIPVRGPGAYSNCDARGDCGVNGFSRGSLGIQAPQVVAVQTGTELQVGDSSSRMLKLDVRAVGNFVSGGRYYNELSGALRRLLTSSEYLQMGGQAGVTFQVIEYIALRVTGTFLYNTDHALTAEPVKADPDGKGLKDNPNYVPDTDGSPRRFFVTGSKDLRVDATLTFSF